MMPEIWLHLCSFLLCLALCLTHVMQLNTYTGRDRTFTAITHSATAFQLFWLIYYLWVYKIGFFAGLPNLAGSLFMLLAVMEGLLLIPLLATYMAGNLDYGSSGRLRRILMLAPPTLALILCYYLCYRYHPPCLAYCDFCVALLVMLCEYSMQMPGESTDSRSNLRKRLSFQERTEWLSRHEVPFQLLHLQIEDLPVICANLHEESAGILWQKIATETRRLIPSDAELYQTGPQTMTAILPGSAEGAVKDVMQNLTGRFRETWKVPGQTIRLYAHLCRICCPEEVSALPDLLALMDHLETRGLANGEEILPVEPYLPHKMENIARVEMLIEEALEHCWFEVWYQPIYEVESGRFLSAEALIRLRHPEDGLISPGVFIPVAEHNGMINRIGRYVLEDVCRMLERGEAQNYGLQYVEVNLSVAECIQTNLAEQIREITGRHHVSPDKLMLEITETASESIYSIMTGNIAQLAEAGFEFALDDFGTGYSNLVRMSEIPFRIIKLDRSLVTRIHTSEQSGRLVRDVIALARRMRREIVAEGVETEQEAKAISDLGTNYIQGFYYAKPMPEAEFLAFLKQKNTKGENNSWQLN